KPRRRQVGGHRAEQASAFGERRDARRHRRLPLAQLAVSIGERVDQRVEVEQLLDVLTRKDDHDSLLSKPSACWFQGTRCVTPAAPTRSRFARYQSYVRVSASRFDSRGCQPSSRSVFPTSTNESRWAVL